MKKKPMFLVYHLRMLLKQNSSRSEEACKYLIQVKDTVNGHSKSKICLEVARAQIKKGHYPSARTFVYEGLDCAVHRKVRDQLEKTQNEVLSHLSTAC